MHTESVILDLSKELTLRTIKLRQGEGGLATIDATILDNGQPYDLTGCSVMFYANDPKGYRVYNTATITSAKNGTASYTVSKNLTAYSGKCEHAYFQINKGTNEITTQDIPIYILENVDLSGEEAHEYESEFEKLLDGLRDIQAKSNEVLDDASTATNAANQAAQSANQAEQATKTAESARVTAEQGRVTAEQARVNAETARANAEKTRQTNETARQQAEQSRESAEQARADEWETIKAENSQALQETRQATNNANAAADRVDTSIYNAEQATEAAKDATSKLNDTIRLATDAAGDATIAASVANATNQRALETIQAMNSAMDDFDAVIGTEVRYAPGDSATVPPSEGWTAAPQTVNQGQYQWTRTVTFYLHGEPTTAYSVARQGVDGRDGIGAESSSLFWLWVDNEGDLYATYSDAANPPAFRYDQQTGNVYATL